MSEDDLKECDCCGEMKSDVRTSFIPHVGDTSACAQCRGKDPRATVLHGSEDARLKSPFQEGIDNESSRPETGQHLPRHAGVSVAAVPDLQAGGLSERDRELRPHGVGASTRCASESRDPSSDQAAVAEDE
jgi:hypothetical protein